MDKTLSSYLGTLLTPSGAPESGTVRWEKVNLFGQKTHARIHWSPESLEAAGEGEEGPWRLVLGKRGEGWETIASEGPVGGGTPLARVRWVRQQLLEISHGAAPEADWEIPQRSGGRRRKSKP